ncbi:hypothetical protein [Pseudomonas syringae]|uniref:hypothetical protein n=1 Tax=Pseudomonas syringae TaxID=317 RepID=UPI000F3F3028|nr:hypothetical protein [Pseudomonas syringae]RMM22400.1 hypothetical protein ALQ82_200179 [Pseudomonas syringae pv. pisi]
MLDTHEIVLRPFTEEMFLFHEEWKPENMFGLDYAEEAEKLRAELANGRSPPTPVMTILYSRLVCSGLVIPDSLALLNSDIAA